MEVHLWTEEHVVTARKCATYKQKLKSCIYSRGLFQCFTSEFCLKFFPLLFLNLDTQSTSIVLANYRRNMKTGDGAETNERRLNWCAAETVQQEWKRRKGDHARHAAQTTSETQATLQWNIAPASTKAKWQQWHICQWYSLCMDHSGGLNDKDCMDVCPSKCIHFYYTLSICGHSISHRPTWQIFSHIWYFVYGAQKLRHMCSNSCTRSRCWNNE